MLTLERKKQMIESLKQDYVVLTDIFAELIADIQADMIVLSRENRAPAQLEQEKQKLRQLRTEYLQFVQRDQQQAVERIEQLYELAKKYDQLRMQA